MADRQIHDFPTLEAAQDTDLILVSNEGETYNISFATLKEGTKGDDGVGIASYTEYYAVNNSTTAPADSAFSTTYTNPTATNRYLWGFTRITYSDVPPTVLDTTKHLICVYGDKGDSVTNATSYFLKSEKSSGITRTNTNGWTTNLDSVLPLTEEKPYLWEYIQFRIGSTGSNYSYSAARIAGTIGQTPSFSIGTVSTLATGSNATASITGTTDAPVLNLGLPRGATGAKGDTGNTPNLAIGTVSTLGTGNNATASITGTKDNPLLNLGLPRGATGATGKSAYDIAVENGYSGTETQWGTDLANAGTNAATATQKAQEAATSASAATDKASEAASSASAAASSASDVQGALADYYTKAQTDGLLNDKADTSDVPTKVSQLANDAGYIAHSYDAEGNDIGVALTGNATGNATDKRFEVPSDYTAHFYGGIATDCYAPGDTYVSNGAWPLILCGFVTASTTAVWLNVHTAKSLARITGIQVTSFKAYLRGDKGYLNNNGAETQYVGASGYTLEAHKVDDYTIFIQLIKSSAFTNVTNNTNVSALMYPLALKFS